MQGKEKVPCDCVLLQGKVLVEESSLTGESIPVIKQAYEHSLYGTYSENRHKRCTLYSGTKII